MEKEDKTLVCKECGKEFIFSVNEQEFYAEKDFSEPVRCKPCREERKQAKNNKRSDYNAA